MESKRIEFIDLAKGVCIIMVTVGHCGFPLDIPGLEIVRMPLYFILSGLFFKTYGGFTEFAIKKTNKILVPFLFFYLIAYLLFYALKWFAPSLLVTDARGILDLFDNRQFFNGPIWFLLALYWCGLAFAVITTAFKDVFTRLLAVVVLSGGGVLLGRMNVVLPMFFDVALTALPYYCFGYYLKQTPILYKNNYDKYNIIIALIFYALSLALSVNFTDIRLSLHYNGVNNILATFALSITSVMTVLFVCKIVKHLPIVSYLGRYSLIILCTHHMVYRPLGVIYSRLPFEFMHSSWFLALTTLLVCWALIPLCIRFIPYFVAQKDLIKWNKK